MTALLPFPPDPPEIRIVEIDPADIGPAPGQKAIELEDVKELLESIRQDGQKVPVIVWRNPGNGPAYICGDGNHRVFVQRILGLNAKAIVLDKAPSEPELIRLRVTLNTVRRDVSEFELADDFKRYISATGCTQAELVPVFNWQYSEATISKILSKDANLHPELRADAERLGSDKTRLISMLPLELQKDTAAKVLKSGMKRDALSKLVKGLLGKKETKKSFKAAVKGMAITLPYSATWELIDAIGSVFREAAKEGQKTKMQPAAVLASLLPSK